MAAFSLSPDPDDPGGSDPDTQPIRLIPGVHEPYGEGAWHCRACSEHYKIGIIFPCANYQAQRNGSAHTAPDEGGTDDTRR